MKKLLLSLLLFPLVSNAGWMDMNNAFVSSICEGFVDFILHDEVGPDYDIVFIPYNAPLIQLDGIVEVINWNGFSFPIDNIVTAPFQQSCYFHSCSVDINAAYLSFGCLAQNALEGGESVSFDVQLEAQL